MIDFTLLEGVVEGKEGFGPHFVEVWQTPSTHDGKRKGTPIVNLFLAPTAWAGERLRVEEFAKHVALRLIALNDVDPWEVSIAYNTTRHRWVATAKSLDPHRAELWTREFVEWSY